MKKYTIYKDETRTVKSYYIGWEEKFFWIFNAKSFLREGPHAPKYGIRSPIKYFSSIQEAENYIKKLRAIESGEISTQRKIKEV